MYMTVLKVNFNTLEKQEYFMDFENRDFLHKWLTSQVDTSREESRMLYSLQYSGNELFFYIQSDKPFPKKNIEKAGMAFVKEFELPAVHNGDRIMFKLFCSAHKIDSKTGRQRFLQSDEERLDWLSRKTTGILGETNAKEIRISNIMIKDKISVPGVEFMGIATVTNEDAFCDMVIKGVGKCKNYGMGLVMYKQL